jgi:uncharacterized protein YecT (DUF1311 family)
MLRRTLHATIIVTLIMTGAVYAQTPTPGLHVKDETPSRTKEQREYDKALDRAYQSAIKKIPNEEKKSADPWGNIRPSPSVAAKNKQQ